MKVLSLARSRRSVRAYSRDPVPMQDLRYVLEVACNAPSGANRQPWRFLVIRDPRRKKLIREACEEAEKRFHEKADPEFKRWLEEKGISWKKPFLTDAPVLLLVFGKTDEPYWIESIWIAVGYMLLAAEELGYSTLTYTPSETRWANELLNIPENYSLQAIIPLGRSAEQAKPKERYGVEEVSYLEEWGRKLSP